MSNRVVIVDDDPTSAKVLRFLLEDEGYDTTVLHRGNAVVAEVTGQETACVVLDVNLPDVDGLTLTKLLRSRRYFGPIVLLTGRSALEDKLIGFEHGADDYVVKPFEPLEVLARVERIVARNKQADQQPLGSILRVEDAELSLGELTYRSDAIEPTVMTPTEMKILEVLMRNSWIVIGRETLIERVWGYDFVGNTNRVDVYIRRVRRKIEPDPQNPQYLHTVRGIGYVFRVDVPERALASA